MQGSVKIGVEGETLEASIIRIGQIPTGDTKYQTVQIETDRGRIVCHYYEVEGTDKGVILVGGVGGGFDTPANGLYPRLGEDLKESGISTLRVKYRSPTDLAESTLDTAIGINFLKRGVSILLIHGKEDRILPPISSIYTYQLAHEPKRLIIYEGAGHSLNEVADEVYEEVRNWIIANLR